MLKTILEKETEEREAQGASLQFRFNDFKSTPFDCSQSRHADGVLKEKKGRGRDDGSGMLL